MNHREVASKIFLGLIVSGLAWVVFRERQVPVPVVGPVRPVPVGPMRWQAVSYEDALMLAAQTRRPIVAVFSRKACLACLRLKLTLGDGNVVTELASKFVFVEIDSETKRSLVSKYGVSAVPTTVVLDADGRAVRTRVGFMPAAEFIRFVGGA